MLKFIILLIFVLVMSQIIMFVLFVEPIPPISITTGSMTETAFRVQEYVKIHHTIPTNLYCLPERKGYRNSIKDGWGNEIQYNVNEEGIITLISLGKDEKPGGKGNNADIIESFNPNVDNDLPGFHQAMSPTDYTYTMIILIKSSIRKHKKIHNRLPEELGILPKFEGYDDILVDWWLNEILYEVNGEKIIIKSLGEDRKPGGIGENSDIIESFSINEL